MDAPTIWHNPKCSKSRETLRLLRERGVEPRIVEYLKSPPTPAELRDVLARLGMPAEALVRKGESVFAEKYAGRRLSEAEWVAAMAAHPVLIERPIVVSGTRAAIGRPPARALALLDD